MPCRAGLWRYSCRKDCHRVVIVVSHSASCRFVHSGGTPSIASAVSWLEALQEYGFWVERGELLYPARDPRLCSRRCRLLRMCDVRGL